MRAREGSGLAFGFALVYGASWAALGWAMPKVPIAWGLAGVGFVCALYLCFVFFIRDRAPWNHRPFLLCLLVVAAASRFALFGVPPETLSDDVYRYLWDGKVQLEGINPYRFAPADEELAPLREDFHAKINHPGLRTIYPPAAQLLFALGYLLAGNRLVGLRCIYLLLELLTAWWLLEVIGEGRGGGSAERSRDPGAAAAEGKSNTRLMPSAVTEPDEEARQGGLPSDIWQKMGSCRGAIFVYLFSPLVLVETYVGMHIDVAGMAFLAGAYRFATRRAPHAALALLVAAVLVKYIALAAAPVVVTMLVRSHTSSRSGVRPRDLGKWTAWSLGVAAVLFLPYVSAGLAMFESLTVYSLHWDFNAPIHWLFLRLAGKSGPFLRGIVFLGLLGYILHRRDGPPRKIVWSVMALVLTGPAVFPWYLLTLVPFLALDLTLGGLAVTLLPFLSYLVLIDAHGAGVRQESLWVRFVVYLPVMVGLAVDLRRRRCTGERK